MAEKHTPTPWVANGRYIGTTNHMSAVGECRDVNGNWCDDVKSSADAAFIVRAVNSHDKLVEALKALLDANDAVQIALCDGPDVPGFEPGELGRAQVHVSEAEAIARAALASLQTQEEGGV